MTRRLGRSSPCSRNHSSACRTLPSSATLSNTSRIASWTRRSGSFSSRSPTLTKPTGARDDEFAASRLLVARRQRPLAQEVELVLVEAALQPEQQPIVALARRVDRLLIDQDRVDDAAHLDQLLPVAAVAGEARHLPGRHRADLAEADLGDHALEAGARDAAGRRAAEVVVDDLDLRPAERVRRSRIAYCNALLSRLCMT